MPGNQRHHHQPASLASLSAAGIHHHQYHHHQVICNGGQASDGEQREVAGKNLPLEVSTLNLLEKPLTTTSKSTLTCFTHQVHLKERMHALEEKNQLSNEVQRMRKSLEDIGNQKGVVMIVMDFFKTIM